MGENVNILFIEEKLSDRLTDDFGREDISDSIDYTIAYSIKESIGWFEREHFDLVILDMEVKEPENLKTILSIIQNVKDIPIVVITESTQMKFLFERMNLGTEFYIAKSKFNPQTFHEKVSFLLETYKVANADSNLFKNNFLL